MALRAYEEDDDSVIDDELAGIGDEDDEPVSEDGEDETPKAKAKLAKAKAASKASDEDEEEEEAHVRKKKVSAVKSNGKEKTSVKTAKTEKQHRSTSKATSTKEKAAKHKATRKNGTHPFPDEQAIVRRAFELAVKGISLKKLKQFLEAHQTLPWVISFLRKGERNGWTWKVEEDEGMFQISNLRKPKAA
jgi:hypothetical protein